MPLDLILNGRDFRITRETVHGAQGYSLREWIGGRDLLHDFGMTEAEAHARMYKIAEELGCRETDEDGALCMSPDEAHAGPHYNPMRAWK